LKISEIYAAQFFCLIQGIAASVWNKHGFPEIEFLTNKYFMTFF